MAYTRTNKHVTHLKRIFRFISLCALIALVPAVKGASPSLLRTPQVHAAGYSYTTQHIDLLTDTNAERTVAGLLPLTSNDLLDAAAQAKADDMVARNYWSHATPDGEDPWEFITHTGYAYQSAGENLASGFSTNSGVIDGWMKSPGHRKNLMSGTYTQVGFGSATSQNYQGDGPQTIIVALYALPQ